MNERIRELAVMCGAWNQVYNNKEFMVDRTFNVEKFANLILQDCIQICEDGTSTQTTSNGIAIMIKQRFGVE
jgi:hypothetical protein